MQKFDQYSDYIAEQTSSLFGVPKTEADKQKLAAYLDHMPRNMLRTASDAVDLVKFITITRQEHLLPRKKNVNNARKRRIMDHENAWYYLLDKEDISKDNDDLPGIIRDIRDDAEKTTEKDEKRQLVRLARRIEETIVEDDFRESFELLQAAKQIDVERGKVNILTHQDIQRICEMMEEGNNLAKTISDHDRQIIHSLLIDQRQLAILACVYRKWTPAQLHEKLKKLEVKLVSWGIIGQTHARTEAVFANGLMNLDKRGNIPFDFNKIQ